MIETSLKVKNRVRLIAAALALLLPFSLVAACGLPILEGSTPSNPPDTANGTPDTTQTPDDSEPPANGMDLASEMPPIGGPPAVPIILTPVASGELVESNDLAVVDYSNTADGYVMIRWIGGDVAIGLQIVLNGPSGVTYNYTLNADGEYEVYPLSDGSGEYTIMVVDLLGGGRASLTLSVTFNANLADEFTPFLHPNQYVNFDENSRTVAKAAELLSAESDFIEKIAAIYNFVIHNITYDVDLANEIRAGLHPNYLPVVDDVLSKGMGICFDFAAVMAAMLRSQGIPTKLVVGNVNGDLLHAWLNVYSEEEGWIDAVIFFDGSSWEMMDPTLAASGSSAASLREFIGDGSNYVELYLH